MASEAKDERGKRICVGAQTLFFSLSFRRSFQGKREKKEQDDSEICLVVRTTERVCQKIKSKNHDTHLYNFGFLCLAVWRDFCGYFLTLLPVRD